MVCPDNRHVPKGHQVPKGCQVPNGHQVSSLTQRDTIRSNSRHEWMGRQVPNGCQVPSLTPRNTLTAVTYQWVVKYLVRYPTVIRYIPWHRTTRFALTVVMYQGVVRYPNTTWHAPHKRRQLMMHKNCQWVDRPHTCQWVHLKNKRENPSKVK